MYNYLMLQKNNKCIELTDYIKEGNDLIIEGLEYNYLFQLNLLKLPVYKVDDLKHKLYLEIKRLPNNNSTISFFLNHTKDNFQYGVFFYSNNQDIPSFCFVSEKLVKGFINEQG